MVNVVFPFTSAEREALNLTFKFLWGEVEKNVYLRATYLSSPVKQVMNSLLQLYLLPSKFSYKNHERLSLCSLLLH